MSRGRKPFSDSITDNWEKAFFNSIGHYITLINKGLSKSFNSEPLSKHIKIVGGFAFKNSEYKSSGVPIIRISDFNNERLVLDNVVYYEESPLLEKYELKESDIIIALTGGTIGKLGIVQAGLGKLYLNQRVGKFEILNSDKFEKEYIYWIARGVEGIVKNLAWGAAIPNVSPKLIEDLNFPIPSKDIQKNIIRFLNNLKDGNVNGEIYFDEEIENEIKDIQEKQVKASEVQDELTYQLTQLENLNQAILQEAVQGKLAAQDPKDEPASELLKRIKADKAKSGKKEKPLPPIKPEEIPFEIPENWVWCRLGEIIEYTENLDIQKHLPPDIIINYVDIDAIDNQNYVIREVKQKTVNELSTRARRVLKPNYIVYSTVRPYLRNIAIVEDEKENFIGSTGFNVIKTLNVELKYAFYYLLTPYVNNSFKDLMVGFNSPSITNEQFERSLFPLPPLFEQKRIVEEVEMQLAKTKQLKEQIIANQQATEQLLKALLHQAFEVKETETV